MKKIITNNRLLQNEYWSFITSTLSSYEVKDISSDGKVERRLVTDDYFLVNDVWDVTIIGRIPNFGEQFKKYKSHGRYFKIPTANPTIVLELKFVFYHKLFNDEWRLIHLFNGRNSDLKKLVQFLSEKYPRLRSLLDLDIDKTEKEWIWWLNNKGINTVYTRKNLEYGEYENKSAIANFLRYMFDNLFNLTDFREEWEKDRWDIRILNKKYGISYSHSKSSLFC